MKIHFDTKEQKMYLFVLLSSCDRESDAARQMQFVPLTGHEVGHGSFCQFAKESLQL